jgi:benzoyl-CoA reductase subunit BamC
MKRTRKIKYIKVDADKCTGCRACEVACAAYHADPKYSIVNPARSRIRVFKCELEDLYVPIRAGKYTEVECIGRAVLTINGKEYGECSFCRQACPSRDLFHEPDSKLALECDMCGEPMPEGGPLCVQWCGTEALTYAEEEIEEEVAEEEESEVVEVL